MPNRRLFRNKAELIREAVTSTDRVLDIGFQGQGVQHDSQNWPHALLLAQGKEVYGVDLDIDRNAFPDERCYQQANAENFSFPGIRFDVIFAGDLIEHLPNPGLFLDACKRHMTERSRLVITTPNCFSLFTIAEKLTKEEPTVNKDHTAYFNRKTLGQLLGKCGFVSIDVSYLYSLEYEYQESWKKKLLNALYAFLTRFTHKFSETLVVTAMIVPE